MRCWCSCCRTTITRSLLFAKSMGQTTNTECYISIALVCFIDTTSRLITRPYGAGC